MSLVSFKTWVVLSAKLSKAALLPMKSRTQTKTHIASSPTNYTIFQAGLLSCQYLFCSAIWLLGGPIFVSRKVNYQQE
jgi:hypothetical protein